MKLTNYIRLAILSASILGCLFINSTRAQFNSTVTSQLHDLSFSAGRDFWLAEMSNQEDGAPDTRLYITSQKRTVAHIQYRGHSDTLLIKPDTTSSYIIPSSMMMNSSGHVENKAIHIWSSDASLIVYKMSTVPYSNDGEYLIPTIGWGNDYVVAAYASLYEGFGNTIYDYPSEMAVVSNQDDNEISITPSCDCRMDTTLTSNGDANSNIVAFQAGQTATFVLNRGQSIEMFPVKATAPDGYDLTGTIVHSSKPVGVFGGAVCTNIPANFPYCDHVEDMIPPTRTWGLTYFGTSFYQDPGVNGHDYGLYLLVSSVPNQSIYRYDCSTGSHVAAVSTNQHGLVWDEEEAGQKYYSDQPFLCVEYINSSSYPDETKGKGDPAEAHINPSQQFLKTVQFETPAKDSANNYANITVNIKDANTVRFDTVHLNSIPPQCIDGNWEIFTVNNISKGSHIVSGDDSGVEVQVYGYGYDQAYMWSSESFEGTFNSPDSAAPLAAISGNCASATVTFTDTGANASQLAAIWIDSVSNAKFSLDTAFHEGIATVSDFFNSSVLDPSKPAFLQAAGYDFAGNSTTVTLRYAPPNVTILPPLQNLGTNINPPGPANVAFDTIINESDSTLDIASLALKNGGLGFSLYDSIGGPLDLSPLAPRSRRVIEVQFLTAKPGAVIDSIVLSSACYRWSAALLGNGNSNDFTVSNQIWINELLPAPDTGYVKSVTISNLSPVSITIDSMWWADTVHFKAAKNSQPLPITVPAEPGKVLFYFAFFPDTSTSQTQVAWFSKEVTKNGLEDPRFDTLIGSAFRVAVSMSATEIGASLKMIDTHTVEAFIPSYWSAPVHLELVNILGETVYTGTVSGTQVVNAGTLPLGMYFYRLTTSHAEASGKILIGE